MEITEQDEQRFWATVIAIANDPDRKILYESSREQLVQWYSIFDLFKADAFDEIQRQFSDEELSDDTIDDLADAVITMGRESWSACLDGSLSYPELELWEQLPTIGHLLDQIFYERFNTPILDEID